MQAVARMPAPGLVRVAVEILLPKNTTTEFPPGIPPARPKFAEGTAESVQGRHYTLFEAKSCTFFVQLPLCVVIRPESFRGLR